jgi:predicted dehydrogenase
VVAEKLFTISTEEADRVIAAQKKSGKILTVFQSISPFPTLFPSSAPPPLQLTGYLDRRYDSDFRTLQELVNRKAFGEITECEIHYDFDFPFWMKSWKDTTYTPGKSMLFGIGSHTIDQALVLFGRPATITGFYRSLRGIESEVDDAFTVILQYGREKINLVGTVKTSVVCVMQYPMKFFVRGYNGSFVKYGEDRQESQAFKGLKATDDGFGVENEDTNGFLTTKEKVDQSQKEEGGRWVGKFPSLTGSYVAYYEDLVKTIRRERELIAKPETARDGLRIIEIARESAEMGCALPFN